MTKFTNHTCKLQCKLQLNSQIHKQKHNQYKYDTKIISKYNQQKYNSKNYIAKIHIFIQSYFQSNSKQYIIPMIKYSIFANKIITHLYSNTYSTNKILINPMHNSINLYKYHTKWFIPIVKYKIFNNLFISYIKLNKFTLHSIILF